METISPNLLTFLVNALWQVALVAVIAMLACRLMSQGPASHRHAVWVAALFAAVLLPLSSVRPGRQSALLPVAVSFAPVPGAVVESPTPAALAHPAPASERRIVQFPHIAATLLWTAYLIFLLLRLARFGRAWLRTVQLYRTSAVTVLPSQIERVWERCRKVFSLRSVQLRSSARIPSPITTGALRNTVILPDALLAETSENILATAIGHEMAHIARHDFALSLLYELLYAPVAFHPAAWIIRRGIERTREMACDELVTRKLLDPGVYAESMVRIAATMTGLRRPGYTLGVFDGDVLEERILRLLQRRDANLKRARLLFATGLSAIAVCVIFASGLALTARAQSESQREMKLAADAYNHGDFKSAVEHFENAVRLDPAGVKPKLFLANALIREFFAEQAPPASPLLAAARRQYQDVLATDPRNNQAMHGMMAVGMNAKDLGDAREWALKLIQSDATDKAAYYTAGVLDWAMVFPEFQRSKQAAGGKLEDYFISDPAVRMSLRDQFLPRIQEGLHMLGVALQLDPQYDDAMAYLNLLYRVQAGMVDNPAEATGLLAKADEWVGKALATRRAHPRTEPAGPSQLDLDGPPPGPAGAQLVVGAPPPPPPAPVRLLNAEKRLASASPPPMSGSQSALVGQYWQVMGGTEMLAAVLFRQLRAKGFPAMMHDSPVDHQVRVVAGPYFGPQAFDQAKGALEAAGFRPIRSW